MTMKFKSFSAAVISALVVMVPMQASALTKQQQDAMISGGKSAHAQKLRAETAHLTKSTGRDLTVKEQRETEGALLPAMAAGAAIGVSWYAVGYGGCYYSNSCNYKAAAYAGAVGAMGGGLGGAVVKSSAYAGAKFATAQWARGQALKQVVTLPKTASLNMVNPWKR